MTPDAVFIESLRDYLRQFSEGRDPVVPLLRNSDGSIDRAKTLALPCFANMKISEDKSHA